MSKKERLPWFKMYPDAYLEDTRGLTPEQRGIYADCLFLMYKYDSPLPKNDAWMAYQLQQSARLWRRIRDDLLALELLLETPNGYVNKRAEIELKERELSRKQRKSLAETREENRRIEPELPFENKGRPPKLRVVRGSAETTEVASRARASSDHQRIEIEKEEALAAMKASKPLPPGMLLALRDQAGEDRAEEWVADYYTSGMAAGAKSIRHAFPAWLESEKDFVLIFDDGRGRTKRKEFNLGDYTAEQREQLLGSSTELPTAEQLSKRRQKA